MLLRFFCYFLFGQPGYPKNTLITYRYEQWRSLAAGVIETAGTTFLLLIVVRHFEASPTAKGIVATGASVGLLISPFVVYVVQRLKYTATTGASRVAYFGALCFLLASLVPWLPVFLIATLLGIAGVGGSAPLYTQLYQDNYPDEKRGQLFSRHILLRILIAGLFSFVAGALLSGRIQFFQLLLLCYAGALAFSGYCLAHIPSQKLTTGVKIKLFQGFRFIKSDRIFRNTLIAWMMMGIANLVMLPLRVEYLGNPHFGLNYTETQIALLVGVFPNIARFILNPLWGILFDRMNFFAMRIVLNLGFMFGILSFFVSDSYSALIAGAIIFGISSSGGDIAWSLWVTKFAPAEHVAEYMSVHTFFTGIRGVFMPIISFNLLSFYSIQSMGTLCAILIFCANFFLFPELECSKSF